MAITITTATMAFCPEGSFADLFVHGLARAKSYKVADHLTITLDDDGTMEFVAAAARARVLASERGPRAPRQVLPPRQRECCRELECRAVSEADRQADCEAHGQADCEAHGQADDRGLRRSIGCSQAERNGRSVSAGEQRSDRQDMAATAITEKVPAFQGAIPADQQSNYTVTFDTDATFAAKADCNTVAGTYTPTRAASGDLSLTLGPSTIAACPSGSYSDLYLLGLGNAASYAVAGGQLTITVVDGGTLVYK